MIPRSACLVLLLAGFAGMAHAQYQWRDAHGRMVFSDMPPPATVPADRILRAPSAPAPTQPTTTATAAVDGRAGSPPAASQAAASSASHAATDYKDKAMAFEKRRQERAEEEAKAAQAAREMADKTRYCEELEAQRRTLASGGRVRTVGADGQRSYLDEDGRKARLEENARALASTCKG